MDSRIIEPICEGFVWGWGNCLKYLERGWNRNEGRGHNDCKKGGGQAKSRSVCLKNGGGLEPPYELCLVQNPSWGNLQKMVYLKSLLQGSALSLISGLNLSNENYTSTDDLLREGFDNK